MGGRGFRAKGYPGGGCVLGDVEMNGGAEGKGLVIIEQFRKTECEADCPCLHLCVKVSGLRL